MTLNPYIHERNPYKVPPDFKELAVECPEFRSVLKTELNGKLSLDWKDRDAVRVLTLTLLKRDFGLDVRIPPGNLVPTLPLRFNYLLWLEDLMAANEGSNLHSDFNCSEPFGLDVGVGASCVYPLLAAKHFKWHVLGSDVDPESLASARENVARNNLEERVELFHQDPEGPVFEEAISRSPSKKLAFTLCNPPFYEGSQTSPVRAPRHEKPAGKVNEMTTPGGEVALVERMIQESLKLKNSVLFFTCMVGHKGSLKEIKKVFHSLFTNVHFSTTEFCQGRTMRWGVAWSFQEGVSFGGVSALKQVSDKKKLHAPLMFEMDRKSEEETMKSFYEKITGWAEAVALRPASCCTSRPLRKPPSPV